MDITQLLQDLQLESIGKGITLFFLFFFLLTVFVIFSSLRSLNRVIYIKQSASSLLIQGIAIVYVFLAISLFILALAIL